jgi:hypothetical protein
MSYHNHTTLYILEIILSYHTLLVYVFISMLPLARAVAGQADGVSLQGGAGQNAPITGI